MVVSWLGAEGRAAMAAQRAAAAGRVALPWPGGRDCPWACEAQPQPQPRRATLRCPRSAAEPSMPEKKNLPGSAVLQRLLAPLPAGAPRLVCWWRVQSGVRGPFRAVVSLGRPPVRCARRATGNNQSQQRQQQPLPQPRVCGGAWPPLWRAAQPPGQPSARPELRAAAATRPPPATRPAPGTSTHHTALSERACWGFGCCAGWTTTFTRQRQWRCGLGAMADAGFFRVSGRGGD